MSEEIKIGDRFKAIEDISYIKKDEIVTISEIIDSNGENSWSVRFKEYEDSNMPSYEKVWGFPHSSFKKIYDNIQPQHVQLIGRIQINNNGFDQYTEFDNIVNESAIVYRQKNADYGDSFAKSVQKRGFIAALTRIEDKFQRIDNIISTGKIEVKSESLEDSLLDMANYCIMTVIEIRRKKNEEKEYSKSVG